MDARTRRKMKRKLERELKEEGIDPSTVWYSFGSPKREKEEEYKPIPGKDFYVETPETVERHKSNRWDHNLEEVVAFIKAAAQDEPFEADGNTLKPGAVNWSWARNWDCKYINIRVDMRDGGFVLINNKNQRISLDALKFQYKGE